MTMNDNTPTYTTPANPQTGRPTFSSIDMAAGVVAALMIWGPLLAGALHR